MCWHQFRNFLGQARRFWSHPRSRTSIGATWHSSEFPSAVRRAGPHFEAILEVWIFWWTPTRTRYPRSCLQHLPTTVTRLMFGWLFWGKSPVSVQFRCPGRTPFFGLVSKYMCVCVIKIYPQISSETAGSIQYWPYWFAGHLQYHSGYHFRMIQAY